jgi:hypothetical protein
MEMEDEETYLEQKEEARLEGDAEQVALAERKEPEKLVELKASFTESQLLEIVAERAIERLFGRYGNESMESQLKKHIHALVEQSARDILSARVDAHIGAAVEEILAEGFQKTNEYGEPKGQRVKVSSFVLTYLEGSQSSYDRGPRWHKVADALVQTYMTKEIQPLLEKLKKRVVDALDTSVAGQIREVVLKGLGLKAA